MDVFLDLASRAEAAPESLALLAPGRPALTYSTLLERIAAIRLRLSAEGVFSGNPLALVFPDGPDLIMTMLATASLGGCAPLDSNASQEEFRAFFSHLRSPTLLTLDGCNPAAVAAAHELGMRVVRVQYLPDFELASVAVSPAGRPPWSPRTTTASLLMFTSSTTGRPKLIPLSGANLQSTCRNETRTLGLTTSDRLLDLPPFFNMRGARAALMQLSFGGSVVCPPRFDPDSFPEWLAEFRPTWISISASGLDALSFQARQNPELWRHAGLRCIRTAGSAPSPRLMREIEDLTGVPVLDGYGATETGCVTCETLAARKSGSAGKSMGADVAIRDESGGPLAAGVEGEIVIRGPGVMAGYLDDDEANRNAFADGWFRTGDLGYFDEDGLLFISGRIKEVINRGGQKVLPHQVEAVLKEHPSVHDAAVFGVPHRTLGEEVAAAVVLGSRLVSEFELRRLAAVRLVPYKVPRHILFVDSLPRNPGGKIQRKLLTERYRDLTDEEHPAAVALSTDTEKTIAAIWEIVLRCGPIGRDANFSRLGGDSLTATLVATRIKTAFGVNLDMRTFVEYPKLRDLSGFVDELRQGTRESMQTLERAPHDAPFPLSFSQERSWQFLFPTPDGELLSPLDTNMACAHRFQGPLQAETLRRAMLHLAARHENLRVTFERGSEGPCHVVHQSMPCELPMVDAAGLPDPARHARLLLREESAKPFHLGRGPLVRFTLVRLGPDEHWLIRVHHHLISDAHSWKVYFNELGRVYDDLLHGRPPRPLGELQAGYRDYALWQRRELSPAQPACRDAIEWWAARFSPPAHPPAVPLHEAVNRAAASPPGSHEPPSVDRAVLTWGLDPEISERLNRLQDAEGMDFLAVRLAAFAALLADLTGQPELVMGAYMSFRHRLEWQNIMGDFTNLVTLQLPVNPVLPFRDFVRAVHQEVSASSARGEFPYEMLCRELRARGVTPRPINVIFHANDHTVPVQFGNVEMTWTGRTAAVMPWGFSLYMDRHNEDRLCAVMFDARLYQPEAVAALVARFVRLLDSISRHPDLPLHDLLR